MPSTWLVARAGRCVESAISKPAVASKRSAGHHNAIMQSQSKLCALVALLILLMAPGAASAQQVTRVLPPFAVAGAEARFTAIGQQFGVAKPAALGMKFTFGRPGDCSDARRFQPVTENAYYFSCTLRPDIASPRLLLTVFHRERAQRDTVLWKGPIQVLPGAPVVESVTLVGSQPGAQTSVICNPKQVCLTLVGDLRKGQGAGVEVRGSNLPASLALEFPGCEPASVAQDLQKEMYLLPAQVYN